MRLVARSRIVHLFVAVLSILGGFTPTTRAQTSVDPTGPLAPARGRYESTMENVREDVERAIKKMDKEARDKSAPLDTIKALEQALADFQSQGHWPEGKSFDPIRQRAAKAAAGLLEAYTSARASALKAKRDDLVAALDAEIEHFKDQSDVIGWRDNLAKKAEGASPRIERDRVSFPIEQLVSDEFRLELVAKRIGPEGVLVVEIPLENGNRLPIRPIVDAQGNVRMIVSVEEGHVSADLGVPRPVDRKAAVAAGKDVIVFAESGAFILDSLRVKPIVPGAPEQLAERPERVPKPKPGDRPDPAAQVTMNSKWSGSRRIQGSDEQAVVATVTRRTGDEFVLSTPAWGGDGTVYWTLRAGATGSLSLRAVRYTGPNPRSYKEISGTGSIDGDHLTFRYSMRVSGNGKSNQAATGSLDLKRN